jgi:hypothetical protein|tara:strand:- start:53 stop:496 length:444 start_codon:yes stop_codon:yes gene_type:complete
MKPIDPNQLFSLFEVGDEEVYEEHDVTEVLKNPYVLMGMVVRGVENYNILDKLYLRNHKKHYENVREEVKYKYFCKIFGYLSRIDSNKFESKYTITENYDIVKVNVLLNELLTYFEVIEQYEKCAIIKKYIDLIYEDPKVLLPDNLT